MDSLMQEFGADYFTCDRIRLNMLRYICQNWKLQKKKETQKQTVHSTTLSV